MLRKVTQSFYSILGDRDPHSKLKTKYCVRNHTELFQRSFFMLIYDALTLFKMYRSMNSLTVSSVCDHSSSVYLDPTSTGTVRHPATDLKYSMLCGLGGNKWIKHYCNTAALFIKGKKNLQIQDSSTAQKYILCAHFWMSSPSPTRAVSQMPGAVCQLSAVRGRTVKDILNGEAVISHSGARH